MMYATKIKMLPGHSYSQNLVEIDSIYVEGCDNPGFFPKAVLNRYLKKNPGSIKVNTWPAPDLIPATSIHGELYVRSTPNAYTHDNLLDLPRV